MERVVATGIGENITHGFEGASIFDIELQAHVGQPRFAPVLETVAVDVIPHEIANSGRP